MQANNCFILVLGIDTNLTGTENLSKTAQWAAWRKGYIAVLVKSCSTVQPFTVTTMPRTYMLCVTVIEDIDMMFQNIVKLMRPSDTLIFVSVVSNGLPQGDWRDTRFEFGKRYGWVANAQPEKMPTNFVGWNKELCEKFYSRAKELLDISHIPGSCIIRPHDESLTVGQELCSLAAETNADMMVLRRGSNSEVSIECVRDAFCTVILMD
jgi:hypothetical protein